MASSFISLVQRVYRISHPPDTPPKNDAIRFGVLGAAAIAPDALITPARSHSEAVVYAVAARSLEKAQKFARKHGVEKAYGGPQAYQELLDDPNVDAVYNPLPNGLHYEWTMKALQAGKHVLLEKPSGNNVEETREMFELAGAKGLVLLEAFHYRFHPAIHSVQAILKSGEIGAIKHVEVSLRLPKGWFPENDIRFDFALGGGAMMDMGCYLINCARTLIGAEPLSVLSATLLNLIPTTDGSAPTVDGGLSATLSFPGDVTATVTANHREPPVLGIIPRMPTVLLVVECEGGELRMMNFVAPTLYHYIDVKKKGKSGKTRTEKVYKPAEAGVKGEEWWTTYRYQLEAFVDKLKGRTPATWISAEDSIANMTWIDNVYQAAGLPVRPRSTFELSRP
ncbi:hypothetical protein PHLGIDRAFT_124697 [Phlebiopsis gigantea 11061_1 CR5-6]|uniref:D-xylose 1-dehydrogenase (NADP(+), D-xylono-1,5-lactone-forming) n=1 Tax=Phlebiopsis gigantea (strain 11061_1 CR5-6) TaxID=745531 RepID=A0A0C3SF63_PHLG1|nr:hypothetical protein PHLGIDRAFT_124697 [Phlebiopsis gigantea 11061_1 CR5-6]